GWLYLAGVMDRYSRRIVGWAMDQNIDTGLVLAAWEMAQTQRQPAPELVFHSDRGSQYASAEFRQALSASQTQTSMSRRCNSGTARRRHLPFPLLSSVRWFRSSCLAR